MDISADYLQVRVRRAGGRPLPRRWHWEPEPFDDFDLWLCGGGGGVYEAGARRIVFSRGDCFILPPGRAFRIRESSAQAGGGKGAVLLHFFIHFEFTDVDGWRLPPRETETFALHRKARDFGLLERIVERAVRAFNEGGQTGRLEADAWCRAALFHLAREDAASVLSGRDLEHYRRIEAICQLIRDDPARPYRVPDLAREHCYSPEHLTRLFKRFKGVSPGEFIIRSRMDAARELLLGSSLTIGQIAATLGYSDMFFFSKQFRRRVGMSPSAYRRTGAAGADG